MAQTRTAAPCLLLLLLKLRTGMHNKNTAHPCSSNSLPPTSQTGKEVFIFNFQVTDFPSFKVILKYYFSFIIQAAYYHHLNTNGTYDSSNPDMHYYKTLVQETSKQHKHKSNKSHSNKGAAVLKCLECNKEFSSILGLQTHQRHHKHTSGTSKKVYTCNECGKEFGMPRNLSVHMRSHHEDQNGEERASEDVNIVTEEHYQSEGNKPGSPHACSLCHKVFPDADTLGTHVTLQHFCCPQCGEAFVRQRHVADHVRKMHSAEEGQYVTGDGVSTEINEHDMKEEPVTVKEENEDENIDVSTLTPTADQQYLGSPNHHALSDHGEQLESCAKNTKSNDTSHLSIHNPSSPNAAQQSNSTNDDDNDDDDDDDDEDDGDDDDDDDDDGTSLSPTPPTEGDNDR